MKLWVLFFLVAIICTVNGLSRRENEEDLEKELLKEIEEEEKHFKGNQSEDDEENDEREDEDELLDEIYDEYRHDPRARAWWSRKSNTNNGGASPISLSTSKGRVSKTTRPKTRRWLRFKQKASQFFSGVHHTLKKAQTYVPHVIKGAKFAAALLGKKKRELAEIERQQKHLRDEIRDMEDELMKKKRK